ncbi:MAG: hypothetical protein H8E40_05000 [Chloroflexi bacterium]|nr:hypothetical protein [Chloroflexota bacterium]
MSEQKPLDLKPGKSVMVQYFGEQIPNQLIIKNFSEEKPANYIVQGEGEDERLGWKLWGFIDSGDTASVWLMGTVAIYSNGQINRTRS